MKQNHPVLIAMFFLLGIALLAGPWIYSQLKPLAPQAVMISKEFMAPGQNHIEEALDKLMALIKDLCGTAAIVIGTIKSFQEIKKRRANPKKPRTEKVKK